MIQPEEVAGHLEDLKPYMTVCEVQVIDFSRLAAYGPWLKTRIDDGELLRDLKTGQRFVMMLIKLGDDEMPAALEGKTRLPYKLSQISGMLCSQDDFRQWVTQTYGATCHNKDEAAQWVREACGVESRSQLDTDEISAGVFRGIMAAFDAWKQGQGGVA